jgi:hypothetical protein
MIQHADMLPEKKQKREREEKTPPYQEIPLKISFK